MIEITRKRGAVPGSRQICSNFQCWLRRHTPPRIQGWETCRDASEDRRLSEPAPARAWPLDLQSGEKPLPVERCLFSRGAPFNGRAPGVFHEQARVISQVPCKARALNPLAVEMPAVSHAGVLSELAGPDFKFPVDSCEAVGMIKAGMSAGSAEPNSKR